MMNLSSVVLVGMPMKGKTAILKTDQKVGVFEARHILLPEGIHCLSPNQPILTVVVPLELELELTIEKGSGFRIRDGGEHEEGLLLDARFNPILQVDYQIQKAERRTGFDFNENASRLKKEMRSDTFYQKDSYFIKNETVKNELSKEQNALTFARDNEQEQDHFYLLLFDIWTNGTIQPIEAMQRAARQAIAIYIPLLRFALIAPSNILVHKPFDSKNNYVKKNIE